MAYLTVDVDINIDDIVYDLSNQERIDVFKLLLEYMDPADVQNALPSKFAMNNALSDPMHPDYASCYEEFELLEVLQKIWDMRLQNPTSMITELNKLFK